ncbi:MAG: LysR family transcriptional regulator [Hyphomicrobiaceae bacterium]
MNWDDYRFFLAVARTGQLSAGGQRLGVDHATVSRRVRSLEESLDAKLFDRSPGGYTLTQAGHELVPIAERIEAGAVMAEDTIGGHRDTLAGTVRIGVPEGVAAYIVVEAAQKLCETYPQLELQLVAVPRRFSLSKREADFVIAVSRPESGRLKTQKIADYKLHVYGSKGYLAQHPPVTKVEDFKHLRGIGYVPDLIFDKELDYIPLLDRSFRTHLTSTSVHVQLQAVLNGAGVSIMHDFMAERHEDLVKVLPEKISFKRSFWMIVHEDYAKLERIRTCSSTVVQHLRAALSKIV